MIKEIKKLPKKVEALYDYINNLEQNVIYIYFNLIEESHDSDEIHFFKYFSDELHNFKNILEDLKIELEKY